MKALLIVETALIAWSLSVGPTLLAQQKNSATKQHATGRPSGLSEESTLQMHLQLYPHDADAHKKLVQVLQDKEAYRAIVAEDSTWLKNNPTDLWALNEIVAYSNGTLRDPENAIAQLRLHLSAIPRNQDPEDYDDTSDQLAGELQRRGRPEEALPLLSELVRLNPNEGGFWADYGGVLSALGQNQQALRAFRRSIELSPSMDAFHEGLAEALLKAGDLSGAESEYRAALSIYDAQYKKGEPTDAYHSLIRGMVNIEAAHGEEHALAETRMKLAHVLLQDKKYDDALVQAKAALEADHHEFAAFYVQAEIFDAKGDHSQADKVRANAASIVQLAAAKEAGRRGSYPIIDARVLFLSETLWNGESGYPAFPSEIVSILEPRIASLSALERIDLATAYFALGRISSGEGQWEKAITSDTEMDNAVSHSRLGSELLKAGAMQNALPHLQRAYELDPQNATFRMEYESLRQRLGQGQ